MSRPAGRHPLGSVAALSLAAALAVCGDDGSTTPESPAPPPEPSSGSPILNDDLGGQPLYPANNWWNRDVSNAPVDSASDAFIEWIGPDRRLHPDFGPPPYGIPYVSVSGAQPRVPVRFVQFGDESDPGPYPIPSEARDQPGFIEGGVPGGGDEGDRHLLVVDRDAWVLFETFATRWNETEGIWEAGSGAIFDLNRNDRRPEGWTSADAAGLAILPGLVRYDEVQGGSEIGHAFRFTLRATDGYVWPASHRAGDTPGALPLGARLRLKTSFDLSPFSSALQNVFRAMQRHGLVLADNGSDLFVTGTMDGRWNNEELNPAFGAVSAGDFEVIELGWR